MSRKALKKTLARLQRKAVDSFRNYDEIRVKTQDKPMDYATATRIIGYADVAVHFLYDYARALEDAYSELAEPLDKKLEKMKKAVENMDKPVQKKDKTKKTPYIG